MARFNFSFNRYDASKRLRGNKSGLSWGNTPTKFTDTVRGISLDVAEDVEEITDQVGEFLEERAVIRTPVDTGKAQASWGRSIRGRGKLRENIVFNTARTKRGLYYLNFVEHGTIHIAPRKFFAKAQAEADKYSKALYKQLNRKIARNFNNG